MNKKLAVTMLTLCFLTAPFACSETAKQDSAEKVDGDVPIRHLIVYKQAGRFCGWPANNGIWSWGNEILVGFHLNYYKESEDRHSIDQDKPRQRVLARSLDGGQSWALEIPQALNSRKESVPCPGEVNFTHPDFAMTCRGSKFHISYDRGKTWQGPYRLPDFGQQAIMARTDYIVNNKNDCSIFLTSTKTNGKEGRPFLARTHDAGKTIDFVSWIAPEPEGYSIMPSTVRVSPRGLVSAIRRYERGDINKGWIELYASNDDGQTWQFLSKAAETGGKGGNPPSMVRLRDGRLCLTYAYRSRPQGVRAKISNDNGKTWGDEIHLRDDGRTWDIGYTRTVQRPDGKLITAYYYTTQENPEQHIAATIWDPDRAK
ncbi:MAG TPA: sialidase family protein [Sedimentisphaerales bacterium]|nr:sialidase family protein [Sedimentisphaerales bacterium]